MESVEWGWRIVIEKVDFRGEEMKSDKNGVGLEVWDWRPFKPELKPVLVCMTALKETQTAIHSCFRGQAVQWLCRRYHRKSRCKVVFG